MSKFAVRIRICSVVLAAALHVTSIGSGGWAFAEGPFGPDDSDLSPGVSSGDFGGMPSSVESLSSGPKTQSPSKPGPSEQRDARNAVERGEVRPFGWLLKKLNKAVPGDVVKVRLKRHGNEFWTYDVTVLNASGRYVLVSMNAATGTIISSKYR